MALTKTEEYTLRALFQKQNHYKEQGMDNAYYEIRSEIAKKLVSKLKHSIMSCQKQWAMKYQIDESECESLIYKNLLLAIDAFRTDKGNCKFESFFWTLNTWEFKNHLLKIYAQRRTPQVRSADNKPIFAPMYSLNATPTGMDDDALSLLESIGDNGIAIDDRTHYKYLLRQIYTNASRKQRGVLKHLLLGKSYSEAGQALGMSASDICNVVKQLRLKHHLLKGDL